MMEPLRICEIKIFILAPYVYDFLFINYMLVKVLFIRAFYIVVGTFFANQHITENINRKTQTLMTYNSETSEDRYTSTVKIHIPCKKKKC